MQTNITEEAISPVAATVEVVARTMVDTVVDTVVVAIVRVHTITSLRI